MGNHNWKVFLKKYKTYMVAAALMAVLICGCGKDKSSDEVQAKNAAAGETQAENVEAGETPEVAEEEPENNLEENTHASVDRLIGKYCEYIANGDVENLAKIVDVLPEEEKERIQNRSTFIESFENVSCYTKDGPIEDSYIVFVCYDMKLINIETVAPDIICLYVGPKDADGDRLIHYGTIDESMQEYVAELEKDPEVQALYDDVRTRYQEAQESDEALAEFIRKITGQVTEEPEAEEPVEETGEATEEETSEEGTEESAEEETSEESEEAQPEEEAEESGEATAQNRETRVTESVNVRKEPSTESERLAVAYQGEPVTQIESYENGWSKVEFKGLTGYIKTEFLE